MRLQVGLTQRGQTHQACFRGSGLVAEAVVTWHLPRFESVIVVAYPVLFPITLHHIPESDIDAKFEPSVEVLVAQWTLTLLFAVPVPADAGLTEIVPTWDRNGLGENLQTDGTQELILRQERAG